MANERYPADTTIDKSDFDKEHCQRILNDSTGDGYTSIYDAFSKAARKSLEDGNPKQAKIYWLLSDACSMMLSSDNKNEPFKPLAVFHDRRSAIADDFSAEDISFFSEIITEVTDIRLKARLADLAWLKASKKDLNNALVAIDAYRQIPLDTETWVRDGRECWYRALSLSAMLRAGAGNRIQEMERDIQQAFDSSKESDSYLALWLADLMANFGLGKSNAGDIAGKLEIIVEPSTVPISLRGSYYWRSGSVKQELKGHALTEFLLKKMGMTWDRMVAEKATLNDIDKETVELFKKEAVSAGRLPDISRLDTKELLKKLHLLIEDGLTNAAIVLFGKDPGAFYPNLYVKIGRFGLNMVDMRFQEVCEGNLFQLLRDVMEQLERKFLVKPIRFEGLRRIEELEYPVPAL